MRIALFEPDIPQNTGNIFRLGACLGIDIDIIEPTPQTVEALMKGLASTSGLSARWPAGH